YDRPAMGVCCTDHDPVPGDSNSIFNQAASLTHHLITDRHQIQRHESYSLSTTFQEKCLGIKVVYRTLIEARLVRTSHRMPFGRSDHDSGSPDLQALSTETGRDRSNKYEESYKKSDSLHRLISCHRLDPYI